MARRTKSLNNIADQLERIKGSGNSRRITQAGAIAKRYMNNIEKSKQWKETYNKAMNDYASTHPSFFHSTLGDAKTAGYAAADNLRVSQRTYMGLNGG